VANYSTALIQVSSGSPKNKLPIVAGMQQQNILQACYSPVIQPAALKVFKALNRWIHFYTSTNTNDLHVCFLTCKKQKNNNL